MIFDEDILAGFDYMDRTRLHQPVENGDTDRVRELIENGADVNGKDRAGNTPLHCACEGKNTEIVQLLLEAGADVNGDNAGNDTTPLHRACSYRRVQAVKLLLEHGADPYARTVSGDTPLDRLAPIPYVKDEEEVEAIIELFREYAPELDAGKYRRKKPE